MFASQLKSLRKSQNLSQDKLASILNDKYETNISKSMISRWENGVTDPQMKYVRLIADYFNVSAEYLVGETTSTTSPTPRTAGLSVDEAVDNLRPYGGKPISDDQKAVIKDLIKGYLDRSNKK